MCGLNGALVGWGVGGGGFLSRQLGKQEQPNSPGADEMDEIESGVQAE